MKILLTSRLWIIGLWIGLHSAAWSSPKTIWSIGQVDGSNEELALFAQFMDYAKEFPHDVQYAIGIAQPENAWPGVQPGPADEWAGSKPHPLEVQFTLPEVEAGSYLLGIALVNTHGSRPGSLVIEVGDDKRTIRLPTGSGDAALTDPSKGRNFRLDLPFDRSLFNRGKNTIRMTTTESWVIWDAVRFDHVDEMNQPAVLPDSFRLQILPLFMQRDAGLVQRKDLLDIGQARRKTHSANSR